MLTFNDSWQTLQGLAYCLNRTFDGKFFSCFLSGPVCWYNLRAELAGRVLRVFCTPPHLYFSWLLSKSRGKKVDHVSTERQKRNIHTWILKIPVNDKRLVVFIAVFLGTMPRQMFPIGQNSQSNLKLICNAKNMKCWKQRWSISFIPDWFFQPDITLSCNRS